LIFYGSIFYFVLSRFLPGKGKKSAKTAGLKPLTINITLLWSFNRLSACLLVDQPKQRQTVLLDFFSVTVFIKNLLTKTK